MPPTCTVPFTEQYTSTPIPRRSIIPPEIGARVRSLRSARGLSLSALAVRAGVGKATLSGLENGTRNATLETCYALAGVLEVPLATLLGDVGAAPREIEGATVTARLLDVFEDADVTSELYHLTIAPGGTRRSPAHGKAVCEVLTVFRGVAVVGYADSPVHVPPDSHYAFVADREHVYAAGGAEPVAASLLIRTPRPRSES